MPKPAQGLHPEDIKAAIRKRGKTLSQLSRDNNLAVATVRCALKERIPKADKIISSFIETPLHVIWPSRYDEQGNRIKTPRKKNRPTTHLRHRKKRTRQFTEGGAR